jgi:hypothetical protein
MSVLPGNECKMNRMNRNFFSFFYLFFFFLFNSLAYAHIAHIFFVSVAINLFPHLQVRNSSVFFWVLFITPSPRLRNARRQTLGASGLPHPLSDFCQKGFGQKKMTRLVSLVNVVILVILATILFSRIRE